MRKPVFQILGLLLIPAMLAAAGAEVTLADQVSRAVSQYVHRELKSSGDEIEASVITLPVSLDKADCGGSCKIVVSRPDGMVLDRRSLVQVSVKNASGAEIQHFGVPVRIRRLREVWVTKETLHVGHALNRTDFERRIVDVSLSPETFVAASEPLDGYEARVNLRSGKPLDRRHLRQRPMVTRREDVRIVMHGNGANGFKLSVPGIALETGQLGDRIQVQQARFNDRRYSAKVIGKGVVEVHI